MVEHTDLNIEKGDCLFGAIVRETKNHSDIDYALSDRSCNSRNRDGLLYYYSSNFFNQESFPKQLAVLEGNTLIIFEFDTQTYNRVIKTPDDLLPALDLIKSQNRVRARDVIE